MPSASKKIYCANSGNPYTISVSWSESSPSIANNTSVISASGTMSASNVSFAANSVYKYYLKLYWHDNRTNSDTLIKTSGAFNSCGMGYGSRSVSGSITVTHKDDGSLNGYVRMRFESPSTSGGWAPGTSDVQTGNTALTTIARASSISTLTGSALGSTVNVTISRKSSSFVHKVEYSFAGSSWTTVSTNTATSATFTPPLSLASQIPSATSGTLTVRVTTMNGSTQIGSAVTKTLSLSVPSSVVPTMGTPTATRIDNGVPSDWGVYVKGLSQVKIAMTSVAGSYGSTIKSYSITGPNLSATQSSGTSTAITQSGTLTYTCKITDSRGRTATKTVQIQVVDYFIPSMAVSAVRCDSSGVETADGTYLRVTADYSIASVSGKNSVASKSVVCNGVSNTEFGDAEPFTLAANASIGSTYILTAKVTDALGKSAEASVTIPTSERIMNVRANKKGLAIGKFSEKDAFEVAWPTYFEDTVDFGDNVNIRGDVGISYDLQVSGRSKFFDGTYVHWGTGITGTAGYWKMCQIKFSQTYRNLPIKIVIAQRRQRTPASIYIMFESSDGVDPTLNGSNFTFEGDDNYNIYIVKSATSTWDLYVQKAESWDSIGVLEYSTNFGYMNDANLVTWTNEQVSSLPSGYIKATNLSNLTRYVSTGLDPNTTLYPLILTNHANKPSTNASFWYIQTFFYSQKTSNSHKYQLAFPYDTRLSIYHRYFNGSSWGAWRRLRNADEQRVIKVSGTKTFSNLNKTSAQMHSNSQVASLLGVSSLDINRNVSVVYFNGDGAANAAHIDGATYQGGYYYALFDRTQTGSIRINYSYYYWRNGE